MVRVVDETQHRRKKVGPTQFQKYVAMLEVPYRRIERLEIDVRERRIDLSLELDLSYGAALSQTLRLESEAHPTCLGKIHCL